MTQLMSKKQAYDIIGGLTSTSKMPCKSYSLPTIACNTGSKMAKIKGSICSSCYADKGFYKMYRNTIEPLQVARLFSIDDDNWVDAFVVAIGNDKYFRWHDSGDLMSVEHLEKIVQVCERTPNTKHWLPTREYGIVGAFTCSHKIPKNLIIRLSAMFPDKRVIIPVSLQGEKQIATSNVHTHTATMIHGEACKAPSQKGECRDCRKCWTTKNEISYLMH